MITKEMIIETLQTCFDPEIPIDLWNLGLIYDINFDKDNVSILMTLTTPGCTMINVIADDVKAKLSKLKGVKSVTVDVTFDPIWKPEMMTEIGREKLGFSKINDSKVAKKENWE